VFRDNTPFYRIGCTGCHMPKHANRRDWPVEELAGQLIWPYTDLLVHESGLTMVSIQIRMILISD